MIEQTPDPPDMTNMCEGESPDHKPGITPAASPDERLREAGEQLANLVTLLGGYDGPGYLAAPNQGEHPDYYAAAKLFDRIMRDEKTGAAVVLAQWRAALAAADREAPDEPKGQKITHGRHCICTPCAVEDWTNPALAPCGMHGKDCPQEYAPLGPAGSFSPPVCDDPKEKP